MSNDNDEFLFRANDEKQYKYQGNSFERAIVFKDEYIRLLID